MLSKNQYQKTIFFLFLIVVSCISYSANSQITNYLSNLSEGVDETGSEEFVPEMVIDGNTIHTIWSRWVSGSEAYLYYSRSIDLGETWETPKLIWQFKDVAQARIVTSLRLAVSGNYVYVCFAEYDYNDNGTGFIYLARSSDSGGSFGIALELANSGGGYNSIPRSFIKADGSNVAIAYDGDGAKEGVRSLFSSDYGVSFTETVITEDNNTVADLWFDGEQMIVVHEYAYYYYGLNTGRVYVSVSNDNGASFITSDVTVRYVEDGGNERERCRCYHDARYVPKVAKDGEDIHLIFTGYNTEGVWTILYARSANNGQSFESAVDINNGLIGDAQLQAAQESIVARGGNVYMDYLATSGKVYLVRSADSGVTLTEPEDLLTEDTHYIQTTWWPQLVIDANDKTGQTVYFGSGAMMIRKSSDGGKNWGGTMFLAPFLESADVRSSVLGIDNSGIPHWLGKARWHWSQDYDIFYGKKASQPEPGEENKALSIETVYNEKRELVIVPSSSSITFDSVMTAETWIKIIDGTNNKLNVFSKVNGYDGDTYQPSGYQMTFHNSGGIRYLNSGIETDKGQFINWTGGVVNDTLWHHIAFTYDANAGLNNFKTYFDGLLVLEQTVTGAIIPGDGLLMIGSRTQFYMNCNYQLDELRLWDRALSQEELLENQVKIFTGEEEGLKLYLNFDDTFKDISGNGNDAIPLYLGDLRTSNFDPPIPGFDMYQSGNSISFNNTTKNASSYLWNFGNEATSEQGNPRYTYGTPGEYSISLKAKNSNSIASAMDHATILGLEKVVPDRAGNMGYATIDVYGGGITSATEFILRKEGEEDIDGFDLGSPANGILTATFDLGGMNIGVWDVVVKIGNQEVTLSESFTVEEASIKDPWLTFSGRNMVLVNMWQSYSIEIGNDGNTDLYGVPWWFAVSDIEGLELELIDFEVVVPDVANELGMVAFLEDLPEYYEADRVMHENFDARVYSFLIPVIPANSSISFHIRLKSPVNFRVKTWLTAPLMEYVIDQSESTKSSKSKIQAREDFVYCLASSFAEQASDVAVMLMGNIGCIIQGAKSIYKHIEIENSNQKEKVLNISYHHFITIAQCALTYVNFPLATYYSIALNFLDFLRDASECSKGFIGISGWEGWVQTVLSFDPNEIVGPAGYGKNNFIQKNGVIPYTIYFENKESATAPAHIVTVTDTLDLLKFDISEFAFNAFGWGDTIFSVPGNKRKEFSMDIDLRPDVNLITRVVGKADMQTGVVKWEFRSLNPETMDLEEDPLIGFLPPNNTSPEGEGFVSFSVGLKEELGTDDQVRNKAAIFFDANEAIITNEYVNTFDLDPPASEVNQIDMETGSPFDIFWTGSDEGSGISHYSIYVMVNDTLLIPWKINTSDISDEFAGEIGSTYKFYSIATDNVSYIEEAPAQYDATTTIVVGIGELELAKEELTVFPNPVKENISVILKDAPMGVYVVEIIGLNGQRYHSEIYDNNSISKGIRIDISNCTPGQYVLKIVYGNKSISKKILIQ